MSSVLRNMKRVNIASLPRNSDNILAQVLQEPPYNFIQYAAAANTPFYLSQSPSVLASSELSKSRYYKDIIIYLTIHNQYFLGAGSRIVYRSFTKMCTRTTTIANNKSMFVALITTLGKFATQTAILLSSSHRYSTNNKLELEYQYKICNHNLSL
jgi:hypothetical protein